MEEEVAPKSQPMPAWQYWTIALIISVGFTGALLWPGVGGQNQPLGRLVYQALGGLAGGMLAMYFLRRSRARKTG